MTALHCCALQATLCKPHFTLIQMKLHFPGKQNKLNFTSIFCILNFTTIHDTTGIVSTTCNTRQYYSTPCSCCSTQFCVMSNRIQLDIGSFHLAKIGVLQLLGLSERILYSYPIQNILPYIVWNVSVLFCTPKTTGSTGLDIHTTIQKQQLSKVWKTILRCYVGLLPRVESNLYGSL